MCVFDATLRIEGVASLNKLTKSLSAFLSRHSHTPEELDLVVDFGAVEDLIAEGIAREFVAAIPDQAR